MQTDDGPFLDNLEENTCFGSSDKFKNFSIGNSRALSKTVNLSRGLDPINKSKFVNHAMLILRIPIGCSYDFNQSECSILP